MISKLGIPSGTKNVYDDYGVLGGKFKKLKNRTLNFPPDKNQTCSTWKISIFWDATMKTIVLKIILYTCYVCSYKTCKKWLKRYIIKLLLDD